MGGVLVLCTVLAAAAVTADGQPAPQAAPVGAGAAIMAADAAGSGQSLNDWLTRTGTTAARPQTAAPDATAGELPAGVWRPAGVSAVSAAALGLQPGQALSAPDTATLAAVLAGAGAGVSGPDLADANTLGVAVQSGTADWDVITTRAGADWVAGLAGQAAGAPAVTSTPLAGLPAGVWLAAAAADAGGPASKVGAQVWQAGLASSWKRTGAAAAASATVDGCDRALLEAAGTGRAAKDAPGPARAGGAYLRMAADGAGRAGRTDPMAVVWPDAGVDDVPAVAADLLAGRTGGGRLDVAATMCSAAAGAQQRAAGEFIAAAAASAARG